MRTNTVIFILLLAVFIMLPFLFARVLVAICLVANTAVMYKKYRLLKENKNVGGKYHYH